ncbi:MAG: UvrD-helicase domain-containing protein [Candidatus Dojkabacteria bacterium]
MITFKESFEFPMINLDILNPPQKEAVLATEGPVLVLAGAGSGKTRVLTYRLAYILDSGLAGPMNILAMTFTNKAAEEMKERIKKLSVISNQSSENKQTENLPWMGTFHSICLKLLKKYGELVGINRNFIIYDSSDQIAITKDAMEAAKISTKEFNAYAIHSYISSAKNELITHQEYSGSAQGYFQQAVARVYPEYQKILKESNAVDFDDLLMLTVQLLKNNKEVLTNLQKAFKYILVDEYQDTNHAQYTIIKLLAEHYKNICCVGDDDQSIYAFRGATIKNILSFEKDYPSAKVIKLEQNYRSTKKILEASHQVISKNKRRKDKKLWTENDNGDNIVLYKALNEENEALYVTEVIEKLKKDSPEGFNDFAVLYRTNAQSRTLEEAFLQNNIPYKIVGGVRFYDRKEVKDILSYLRLIYNPKDNSSFKRVVNTPRRGIGDKSATDLEVLAKGKGMGALQYLLEVNGQRETEDGINPKLKAFASMIVDLIKQSKEKKIIDFINLVLEKTKYIEMLDDGTAEGETRIENLKELISLASKFEDQEPEEALENFLGEISLLESFSKKEVSSESVTLMTIHSAKGLEFEYVFVVGMEENLFPHSNSMMDEHEMEEERRLAYVAITRAKKKLFMTYTKSRKYFGKTQRNLISRFIEDIDNSILDLQNDEAIGYETSWSAASDSSIDKPYKPSVDLSIGDKVRHDYFGKGTVEYIDSDIVIINFGPVYGKKELMMEYAKLEKLDS